MPVVSIGPFEVAAGALALLLALIAVSFLVEALRRAPRPPERLARAPDTPVHYVDLDGVKVRFIKAGPGPNLVLLHTLRTQLDLFAKVVPDLAKAFTVYAIDYPGHGYSDIPPARYDAGFFVRFVGRFLEALDLGEVTLCGVSIGGAVSLILAGRGHSRVARVIAVNPYDYAKGRGMARSPSLGWLTTMACQVPVLGETFMRLQQFIIMRAVLRGGVANRESISPALMKEMYLVGNRRGHYRAFVHLLRHAGSWEAATGDYANIKVPVCLIWGDQDWCRPSERERHRALIPGAQIVTVESAGCPSIVRTNYAS